MWKRLTSGLIYLVCSCTSRRSELGSNININTTAPASSIIELSESPMRPAKSPRITNSPSEEEQSGEKMLPCPVDVKTTIKRNTTRSNKRRTSHRGPIKAFHDQSTFSSIPSSQEQLPFRSPKSQQLIAPSSERRNTIPSTPKRKDVQSSTPRQSNKKYGSDGKIFRFSETYPTSRINGNHHFGVSRPATGFHTPQPHKRVGPYSIDRQLSKSHSMDYGSKTAPQSTTNEVYSFGKIQTTIDPTKTNASDVSLGPNEPTYHQNISTSSNKLPPVISSRVNPKICGLHNLGNTCYMNSALQCLVHTKPLRNLIESSTENENMFSQAFVQPGPLADEFFKLIKEMLMLGINCCSPSHLKRAIGEYAPIFKGNSQQDAQEFISLFITGLHEEFNEIKGEKPYVRMEVDETQFGSEEELMASEWRALSEKRDKSRIIDIFYGQIKCTLKCQNKECGFVQRTFEPVFPLTLPLPKRSSLTLEDCLELYTKEKISSVPWYCDHCNEVVDLSRKVDMWKMPPILMVYLKRFVLSRGVHIKVNDHVDFDFVFPLEKLCPKEGQENAYHLYAVINHTGSLHSGHYYAYVKCGEEWYECNDSRCSKMREEDVITSSAYVLFYECIRQDNGCTSI